MCVVYQYYVCVSYLGVIVHYDVCSLYLCVFVDHQYLFVIQLVVCVLLLVFMYLLFVGYVDDDDLCIVDVCVLFINIMQYVFMVFI